MAMAKERKQKLKVFRTPIGFHDAFVAAPSRKAALEAWGADANLFAQGMAEQVDDPDLMKEPLSRPGEVIKRLRGSEDEHVAALGKAAGRKEKPSSRPGPAGGSGSKKERGPKPDRAELDAAEEAAAKAEKKQRKALREIDERLRDLDRKRRELLRKHEAARDSLAETCDRARTSYERAMRAWKRS